MLLKNTKNHRHFLYKILFNIEILALNFILFASPVLTQSATSNPEIQNNIQNKGIKLKIPKRGLPGRRETGSTRSPNNCIGGNVPILALLLPSTNLGLTTDAYPQFFWHMPKNKDQMVKFALSQEDEEKQKSTVIYSTIFKPNSEVGITSLTLPRNGKVPPLRINQTYKWSVSLICNLQDTSPRSVITVYGWVQRVAISKNISNQLNKLNPQDRITFYAAQGIWFNLLLNLADLRACQPFDTALSDTWVSLLKEVDLQALAQQPILQKCAAKEEKGSRE
jgi:Domain of Unknown Function (DUF928)